MANFPFIDISDKDVAVAPWIPPREFEWDYKEGQFILRNGCISIVEGVEALRIWIYKCLITKRGRYDAYSWDYGTDLESLIGTGLTREAIISESKRMVKDALLINSHILEVINFKVTFGSADAIGHVMYRDDTLVMNFTVVTDCGNIDIEY